MNHLLGKEIYLGTDRGWMAFSALQGGEQDLLTLQFEGGVIEPEHIREAEAPPSRLTPAEWERFTALFDGSIDETCAAQIDRAPGGGYPIHPDLPPFCWSPFAPERALVKWDSIGKFYAGRQLAGGAWVTSRIIPLPAAAPHG